MREFKIPGKVQAKQRPRLNVKNGRVYTPQPTLNYENFVKMCYVDYANQKGWTPFEKAIRAEIKVFMPIPKSDTKKEERSEIKR